MPITLLIIVGIILLTAIILWVLGERGKLMLPATKRFIREAGVRRFLNFNTFHGYIYQRLQKQYLKFLIKANPTSPPFLRKFITDRYHSKILTPEHAKKIITLNKDIPLQKIEQIIPHNIALSIVLNASPKKLPHLNVGVDMPAQIHVCPHKYVYLSANPMQISCLSTTQRRAAGFLRMKHLNY